MPYSQYVCRKHVIDEMFAAGSRQVCLIEYGLDCLITVSINNRHNRKHKLTK